MARTRKAEPQALPCGSVNTTRMVKVRVESEAVMRLVGGAFPQLQIPAEAEWAFMVNGTIHISWEVFEGEKAIGVSRG